LATGTGHKKDIMLTSKKFALKIEEIVKEKRISYIDAVVYYCEKNNIDTGTVGNLINKSLKEKIKGEAENLNFLPKSSTLPL
tara:strand:+ start:13837 stop:14082 length:246 start_codon:yes stop_codon:yes gene_type:complete